MSKMQTLRALVSERLTAAAEEIFALVERTIAEYEEELCRFKEENQRKQQMLDSVLSPQLPLYKTDIQSHWSPESSLKQEIPETPQEPEEQSVKQEEEQLPPFTAVCVKSEDLSSLLHLPQQRQTEHIEGTQGEKWEIVAGNISFEPHGHFYKCKQTGQVDSSETDDAEDWEPPASISTAQMETEADGDHDNQVQIKDTSTHNSTLFTKYNSAPLTSATVRDGHTTETEAGQGKKHECPVCKKRLTTKRGLQMHKRVHTGEKPYRCSICNRTFTQKPTLDVHMRRHTGERPYSCSVCQRAFGDPSQFRKHKKIHTGETVQLFSL